MDYGESLKQGPDHAKGDEAPHLSCHSPPQIYLKAIVAFNRVFQKYLGCHGSDSHLPSPCFKVTIRGKAAHG